MSEDINKNTQIELKKLAGVDSLSAAQISEVLQKSALWITNFYSESAGDKKVKGDFAIEGFSYGGEFDLSTAQDILDGVAPPRGKVPYLFLSDLVNFVEQIRTSLSSKNISLDSVQRQELDRLGSTFRLVGVNPASEKITVEELQKIEYFDYSRRIVERIKLIYLILKQSLEIKSVREDKKEEEKKKTSASPSLSPNSIPSGGYSGSDEKDNSGNGEDNEDASEQAKKTDHREPPDERSPIKISELDPQAKLYIQSLSIITINQALSKYFNEASLAKIGLPPGTMVTFDQLPFAVRQKLMDRAFLQVENLLLTGQFSLDKLISEPSQRINFSNQAAFGLLMDVHGLNLLNGAVREIAKYGEKKIQENEKTKDENLNSEKAQKIVEESKNNPDFAKIIESELSVVGDERYLDEIFSKKITEITGYQDSTRVRLVIENVRPLIEVFIQQGLPPEYLIPNPRNFDYNRFVNIFGNSLDKATFNAHKEELANLIIFYWKRKRAIWSLEVRQEIALEKYTPEEAQRILEEIQKDPQKLAQLRNLGALNLTYGGRQITEELYGLAGISSPEMQAFQNQQTALLEKFLTQEIGGLSGAEQQSTLKIYFEFYTPGVVYETYSMDAFQDQIAPQINPMDLYMLQMAENFGTGAFDAEGGGFMQQAFDPNGNYRGTGLMDSALGQQGKKLATKALSQGLYMALDAAGGWGQALKAAEAAAPFIKKLKEQLIEMGLEKVLEWVKKHWPILVLGAIFAALAAMLPWLILLLPAVLLLRNLFGSAGGAKNVLLGTGKATHIIGGAGVSQSVVEGQTALQEQSEVPTQAPQAAKGFFNQFSSSAMVTASQAVAAAFGTTALFFIIQQTSLNSAFLTDFPISESEIINSLEKTSKYAEISKTAKIKTDCASPENDGTKCESPSFPLSIEYTVTIKPKEDFSLQITNIKDNIKFGQSSKGWEESGQSMPSIDSGRELGLDYFQNLIKEQIGLNNTPLSVSPTPSYVPGSGENITDQETPTHTGEFIIIPAGDSLTFTYTLDDLDSNYNNTAILNTIEVNFYYQNAFMAGMDNVITAARICLGECGGDAGCWPSTGHISQMPYGDFSHSKPPGLSFMDAYDIGCNGCSSSALYGPPVYAPFNGELCFGGCRESEGCFYTLSFENGGSTQKINFLHFQDPNPVLSTPNQCMQVEAGFLIGLMGNRGFSTGVHLHYGAAHSGVFYMANNPGLSTIETLVPEDDGGNYPPKYGENVTTCY